MDVSLPYKFSQKEIIKRYVSKVLRRGIWSAQRPLLSKDQLSYSLIWGGGNTIQLISEHNDTEALCIDSSDSQFEIGKVDPVIIMYSIDNSDQLLTEDIKKIIKHERNGVPFVIVLNNSLSHESLVLKDLRNELMEMNIDQKTEFVLYSSVQKSIKKIDALPLKIEQTKNEPLIVTAPFVQELVLNNDFSANGLPGSVSGPTGKSRNRHCIMQ